MRRGEPELFIANSMRIQPGDSKPKIAERVG
jgi:hypothetical protein